MTLAFTAVIFGLALLVWSADRFVEGSAATAKHFGVPPLLIGMVVIGFGTSAPEMVVSALSASQGNPGIALGNAYGSNIANIAMVLGFTALVRPITVHSQVLRKELPVLALVTVLAAWQVMDGSITRIDAWTLLGVFAVFMGWTIWQGMSNTSDTLAKEMEQELEMKHIPLRQSLIWLVVGLVLLIISSRILVWGAVDIAQAFGVSDVVIGLTVIAVGTSLPELASSLVAARKGEHDIALGNIIGSNMFNTLAVVGIAGAISPMSVGPDVLTRDVLLMSVLTISLFIIGIPHSGRLGRINRLEGAGLLTCYIAYTVYLVTNVILP